MTRGNPDFGGRIPDSIHGPGAPVQTQQEYILDRIDYYKNDNHLSDMETVIELLKGLVVCSGRDGWEWLRRWHEKKQGEAEQAYRKLSDGFAKSIDNINSRLKEFDR